MLISCPSHSLESSIMLLFLVAEESHIVCIHHIFFIRSSGRHLGCSRHLAVVGGAAVNVDVGACLWCAGLMVVRYVPRMAAARVVS